MFDGNGYTITNLTINRPSEVYVGLFGFNNGIIKNLELENADITGSFSVGALVGYNNTGIITACSVTGDSKVNVNSGNGGGLVGYNVTGKISKSYTVADVKGGTPVGGFVGISIGGVIEQCYTSGNVSGGSGFVGELRGNAVISNSFSTGNISHNTNTAGFVGNIGATTVKVENCYSTAISAVNGFNRNGTVISCYFDKDLTTATNIQGRTGIEMSKKATYENWDFEKIWQLEEGEIYPTLRTLPKPDDEYIEIHNADQLAAVQKNLSGRYRLMSDIDMDGYEWAPIGTLNTPFNGIFDGNGYTIKDFKVNRLGQTGVGFFAYNNGIIKDVELNNVSISGTNSTGSLVGHNNGIITSSSVTGDSKVSGSNNNTGGLVGFNNGGKISKSYSEAEVRGYSGVGGFLGHSINGLVEESYSVGKVIPTLNYAGGFVGWLTGNATVKNCFSTGDITSFSTSAGFVGVINATTVRVENCYSTATNTNGFNWNGTVINSYFNKDLLSIVSTNPLGRSTLEMALMSTYIGWDFANIWILEKGSPYPTLRGLPSPYAIQEDIPEDDPEPELLDDDELDELEEEPEDNEPLDSAA
jgi:hypothetical protein